MVLTFGYVSGLKLLTKELQNHIDDDFIAAHPKYNMFLVSEFIILYNIYGFDKILLFNYYIKGFGLVPRFTKAHKLLTIAKKYCNSIPDTHKKDLYLTHTDQILQMRIKPFLK